jgi:hypothetical protein
MILFLDFDGVLHPEPIRGRSFQHLAALAAALAPYPDVCIVVSSSWRERRTLDDLRRYLPDVAERVVGATPVVPGNSRQREIEAWLAESPTERWLALDDMPVLFDPDCPWLLAVDGAKGLDRAALLRLGGWLATGELRTEALEEGSYEAPDVGSGLPPFRVEYIIDWYQRRIELAMTHIDTFRLALFLEETIPTLGIPLEEFCLDDANGLITLRPAWRIEADVGGQRFDVQMLRLGVLAGGLPTMLLHPIG